MRRDFSDEEKTELLEKISDMANEGTLPIEIAEILDVSRTYVRLACKKLNIRTSGEDRYCPALTIEQLEYFVTHRTKNENLGTLSKKLGVSVRFLSGLQKYLKLPIECLDCYTTVQPNKYGIFPKLCSDCKRSRYNARNARLYRKRYREDPIYRAFRIKHSQKYKKKVVDKPFPLC